LKQLKDKGVPVNGIGLQAHWSIYEPSKEELEATIQRFASLGLKVQITELDISVYPWEKAPRKKTAKDTDAYTATMEVQQAAQYKMAFDVFRKYKNVITGVTFWNISDKTTWLDHYPVEGRKNYPLLFDINLKPKKAYETVTQF
jgi:endo-1,4-beta-xylanase